MVVNDMYILVEACNDASFMTAMLFIKKLVDIIFIIAPILLILLLTIDFSKAVIANDESRIKHLKDVSIKRILFAVLLFFVPLIVDTSFSLLPSNKSKVIDCYNNASEDNVNRLVDQANLDKENQENNAETKMKNIRNKQAEDAAKRRKNASEATKKISQKNSSGSAVNLSEVCTDCSWSERIAQTAEVLAWPKGTSKSVYKHNYSGSTRWTSWSQLKKAKPTKAFMDAYDKVRPGHFTNGYYSSSYGTNHYRLGASCDVFAATVVRASGYDKAIPFGLYKQNPYLPASKKWKKVSSAKRGDFCNINGHSMIYLGNGLVAQGSYHDRNSGQFGAVEKGTCKGYRVYRAIDT